jgi:hypothetical protein
VTLNPVDDAYVAAELAGSNFGQTSDLQSDLSPVRESYLKFDLRPLVDLNISQATLRMFVTSSSNNAQSIKHVADNNWTENAINFNNRPPKGATITTFTPGSTTGTYLQIPITSAVASGTGSFMSLAIDSTGSDGFDFNSAEAAADKVELVIQWSGGGVAPTPTPTPAATPTPTATPLPTPTPATTPTPTPGPTIPPGGLILNPVDDAYVAGELTGSNFGQTSDLQSDLSPTRESYLKFDLRPLAGTTISQATLRMFVTSSSNNAQNIKQVADNSWTETALTFNNRPPKGATVATFTHGSTTGVWREVVITSAVAASAGSFLSLAIDAAGSDGFDFNSAEASSNRVELVIQ